MPPLRSASAKRRKRRKGKDGPPSYAVAARWLFSALALFFLAWAVFVPQASGSLGRSIHSGLLRALGPASYGIPVLLGYAYFWYYRRREWTGAATLSIGAVLSLAGASALLGSAGGRGSDLGGAFGAAAAAAGESVLGRAGTFGICLAASLFGLQILFGISWVRVLGAVLRFIHEDVQGWRSGRRELKTLVADAARKHLPAAEEPARMAPVPAEAKRGGAAAPAVIPVPERAPGELPPIVTGKEKNPPKKPKPAPAPKQARRGKSDSPYERPPLGILQSAGADPSTGKPSETEIRASVDSLEAALKSFEIDARITEVHPGPVITRYEVSPAPGVTVNSIVARSNDIALATRARSIRMIAPIPGKAAVGIEIPNQKPVTVTLREVLESSAMSEAESPLAFALGLSSDGTPLAADLGAMPHVLVAGATASGKSVMVHAMIASILFRETPDRVKLLLIDPKRIELALYDGIPHLYDPKSAPSEVQVITQAKKAARALKSLVRVMEDRYEKFQAWKVRDIAQYNREAAKRGDPEEFYIVVVIDELADLMVIARDEVQDSIQRLTQMARAVGIHMVIATQRPSVDVLTGVIKANLPSRIAMRVSSTTDSRVVIDSNGAEALMGRGDALYMSAGRDPERIQGCFVSTEEIGALVEHLKNQGEPDYPLLEPVAVGGGEAEADLAEFGIEPLDATRAMKLVLDRKRVSQDLLKSQFGSSAKATNLLSFLEVKGFILKPEGAHRWQVQLDKIEDHLRRNYPQIDLDKPGI